MEALGVSARSTWWTHLGRRDYQEAWELQEHHRSEMLRGSEKAHLYLVEHPPTITLGRAEDGTNLKLTQNELLDRDVKVVETNRGGHVTYHGPGQLVAYPVVYVNKLGGIKCFVHDLEEVMLCCLAAFDLKGERHPGFPGIWVNSKKIGSIGIHVRKQVSIHGLALNVNTDLAHFSFITPCGLTDVTMTSLQNEGVPVTLEEMIDPFLKAFTEVFGKRFHDQV